MMHHQAETPVRGLLVYVTGRSPEESAQICSVLRNLTGIYAARTFADKAVMLRRCAVSAPDACIIPHDGEQDDIFLNNINNHAPSTRIVILGGQRGSVPDTSDILPSFAAGGTGHTKFVVAAEHIFSGLAAHARVNVPEDAASAQTQRTSSAVKPLHHDVSIKNDAIKEKERASEVKQNTGGKIKGNVTSKLTFTLPVHAVVIGSSTGGPDVLNRVFTCLNGLHLRCPVFLTQHMPEKFTAMLAERLSRAGNIPCKEGIDGEAVVPGTIYVAPGNYHMRVRMEAGVAVIRLDQENKVNFCRPAVDPMMESIAQCYGSRVLGAVLTGMGNDGAAGAAKIRSAGGKVVIQDEEGSAVWGMPGAAHASGAYDEILTPEGVAHAIASANHMLLSARN